jgi:hypothetical protein
MKILARRFAKAQRRWCLGMPVHRSAHRNKHKPQLHAFRPPSMCPLPIPTTPPGAAVIFRPRDPAGTDRPTPRRHGQNLRGCERQRRASPPRFVRLCCAPHPSAGASAVPVTVAPFDCTITTLSRFSLSVAATAQSSLAGTAPSSLAGTGRSIRYAQGGTGLGTSRSANIFKASGKSLSC